MGVDLSGKIKEQIRENGNLVIRQLEADTMVDVSCRKECFCFIMGIVIRLAGG